MKWFNFRNSILACLFVALASSSTFAGGETGNGGNTRQSTVSDIEDAIKDLRVSLYTVFSQFERRTELWNSDPLLTRVMTRLYQPPTTIFGDLNSKMVLQDECIDQNGEVNDGGAKLNDLKGDICFSTTRLTRLSKEALRDELIGLAMHEHVHHFGFGEEAANKLQDLYLSNKFLSQYRSEVHDLINIVFVSIGPSGAIADAAKHMEMADEDRLLPRPKPTLNLTICREIGKLDSLFNDADWLLLRASRHNHQFLIVADVGDDFKRALELISNMGGYCGSSGNERALPKSPIAIGDFRTLARLSSELLEIIRKLDDKLSVLPPY